MLTVEGLAKSIGAQSLWSNLSFDLNPGDAKLIVGRSGSGKTTLLRCLAFLEEADAGMVWYDRTEMWAFPNFERSRSNVSRYTSFVFQDFGLWPHLSIRDNLQLVSEYNGHAYLDTALELCDHFNITPSLEKRVCECSPGELQRAAIARSIARDVPYYFLDEPTSSLDAANVALLYNVIEEMKEVQGRAFLIVSHHPEQFSGLISEEINLD